jgi:hypothetical protein
MLLRSLRAALLGIAEDETRFARRGFTAASTEIRERLEEIGTTFVHGYHAALRSGDPRELPAELGRGALELRGFAFEGAAMGLTLLDLLSPYPRDRLKVFLAGGGAPHVYMVHVGAGWAMARVPLGLRYIKRMDPLLRWLAVDGYGFYHGYFHSQRYVEEGRAPNVPAGYGRSAFDQGLGRSLWFVYGADVDRIAQTIARSAPDRKANLWSGIGLAAAYAADIGRDGIERLRERAVRYLPALAQGAAFAAKARQRAGNPADHTELACNVLCGTSAAEAARIADEALSDMRAAGAGESYEVWRARIRALWSERSQLCRSS